MIGLFGCLVACFVYLLVAGVVWVLFAALLLIVLGVCFVWLIAVCDVVVGVVELGLFILLCGAFGERGCLVECLL